MQNRLLLRIKYLTMVIVQRVAVAIAIFSLVKITNVHIPEWIYSIIDIFCILAGTWLVFTQLIDQLSAQGKYSPGAQDNASGVAVLMAIAERLGSAFAVPIAYLITSAEETGMHGADAFASAFPADQQKPAVLCLDMVGAGNKLFYITGDSTFFPLSTSAELNNLLRIADPSLHGLWYTLRSGDFTAFLRHGFAASALQSGGSVDLEITYHTAMDTLNVIEPAMLIHTADTVIKFIQLLSKTQEEDPT